MKVRSGYSCQWSHLCFSKIVNELTEVVVELRLELVREAEEDVEIEDEALLEL